MNFQREGKILAIDYGEKRIGLAINQGSLAEPLKVLNNDQDFWQKLIDICCQEQVTVIVIGISEGIMAAKSYDFTEQLKKKVIQAAKLNIQVKHIDETLSSKKVREKFLQAKVKKKKRQGPIDHYAAALILEEFLEE